MARSAADAVPQNYRNHDNDFEDTFNEAYQYYDTELEEPYFDFDNQEMNQ